FHFFFQAEDGIRDFHVTGVQTCALPIFKLRPVEQIIVEDRVVLAPIHFDFDKHNIKPQAALELDKLVQVMKKYPKMEIRVEAHRSEERRVGKEQKSRQTRSNHKEKSNIR